MSRLIPHGDMSADQIIQCSYDAMAVLRLCEGAAWAMENGDDRSSLADAIGAGLRVAQELLSVVHDALESHEGVKGGAA